MRVPETDAIAEMLGDLLGDGRPSLAWLLRWSRDGDDPLRAAWKASEDPAAMLRLGTHLGLAAELARVLHHADDWLPRIAGLRGVHGRCATTAALRVAAVELEAGRASTAAREVRCAMERWPVARTALCNALRAAVSSLPPVEHLLRAPAERSVG